MKPGRLDRVLIDDRRDRGRLPLIRTIDRVEKQIFGAFVAFAELGPSAAKLPMADTKWGLKSVAGLSSIF